MSISGEEEYHDEAIGELELNGFTEACGVGNGQKETEGVTGEGEIARGGEGLVGAKPYLGGSR